MNPNNGEIYAMASNKAYDLNNPTDLSSFYTKKEIKGMAEDEKMEALNKIWRNFTLNDAFEPGSTFKPVTIAAALEEGIVSTNETFICDGLEVVDGHIIKCSKRTGHGEITLQEALMKSCNDAMMQIVAKEGKKLFYNYQNFLGLGDKTGIDLPGEANGILMPKKDRVASALATNSFGQNFTSTMVQMAAAYSSLINGGYFYQPHVAKEIINDKGATVKAFDKILIRKTVSEETSDFIKEAMFQTVEAGTAKYAQVPGYTVGGKTGTAQKLPRSDRTYIVSFIGNVPADNPEIVIYVAIDEPQNVLIQADSSLATKLTSKILAEVLPFLEIYPSEEEGSQDEVITDTKGNTGNNTNKSTEGTAGTKENDADKKSDTAKSNTENKSETQENNNSMTNQTNEGNNSENGQEKETNTKGEGNTTEDGTMYSDEFNPDAISDPEADTGE
jgi:stage V sporulation protein D (sporulation-specific penicillin-binding protein)